MNCWARSRGVAGNCPQGCDVILDIPDTRQKTDIDCGPACVRAVLKFWKVRAPIPVADAMDGVHPLYLETAFRNVGLRVMSGEMDPTDLQVLTRRGKPVVCLVQHSEGGSDQEGHWVVCRGISRGRAYLMDPLSGFLSEKLDTFSYRWHDTDRHGSEFRGWAVCAWRG